jgi:glycine cleavage system regulatory protein
MNATLVLTLMGPDKPGLVEAVSRAATRHGANWESSRMARLGGRFTGLLLIRLDPTHADALQAELEGLSAVGLRVMVERSDGDAPAREGWRHARLDLVGTDRPGIMHNVSALLTRLGVNVEELESECTSAPMAGGDLFRLSARLACPPSLSESALSRDIEQLANDLMVDITLDDRA